MSHLNTKLSLFQKAWRPNFRCTKRVAFQEKTQGLSLVIIRTRTGFPCLFFQADYIWGEFEYCEYKGKDKIFLNFSSLIGDQVQWTTLVSHLEVDQINFILYMLLETYLSNVNLCCSNNLTTSIQVTDLHEKPWILLLLL